MAIVNKDTLKNWFLRGMKPLSSQFSDWMDSYWHKNEKISTVNIDKLDDILGTKAEYNDLQAHLNDAGNPHRVTAEQLGIDMNVNLSLTTDESTNTINNTHGYGVTLSTASEDDAGLMGADDRVKMDTLFDGTMLDKTNPIGYHTHNYLEMSDLPQTIELAAATYDEFKAAVIKLQTEAISQGKYGRIVQTGIWIRKDNTRFDLTNIEISNPAARHIEITNYPLELTGRCLFQFLYLLDRNALTADNKLMLEFIESNRYDFLEINKLQLTNGFGTSNTTTTPVLKITGSTAVTVDIKNILGFTFENKLYGERPLVIETSFFSEKLTLKLANSELPLGKKTYLKLDSIPERYGLDVVVDSSLYLESNLDITNSIQQIQKKFNDLNAVNGLVPFPAPLQKNADHFLNALGEWANTTTNLSSSLTTDTVTVENGSGDRALIPASTPTTAGVMTADDRVKMTQLFDGSVISYQKDGYGHRHSYLELQDAPSQLQLTASTFTELKEAVNKLNTLGRKGEILITGIITISEDITFTCDGISFIGNGGTFNVEHFPLKIYSPKTNVHANLRNISFYVNKYNYPNPVVTDSHTAIEYSGNWSSCMLENVTFTNLYCDANPRDTLVINSTNVKFYLNNTTVIAENFPANFKLSFNTANVRIVNSQSINSQPLCLKIPSNSSGNVQTDISNYLGQVPANVTVTNLSPFFSASPIGGYIPSPAPSQKNTGYFLNALGEWIDVRTLPANGGNADTVEDSGWLSMPGLTTTNKDVMWWNPEFACRYRIVGKQCYFHFSFLPGTQVGSCTMVVELPATLFDRMSPIFAETDFIHKYQDNTISVEISKRLPSSKHLIFFVNISTLCTSNEFVIYFSYPLD